MTIEQAKSELMQIYGALSPNKQRAIDTLVKIEPCEDAISRSSLLGKLDDCYKEKVKIAPNNMAEGFAQVEKLIKQESSVNPQEPKTDVLDKIRAEIDGIEINGQVDEHTSFIRTGEQVKQMAFDIIDKYKAESEERYGNV